MLDANVVFDILQVHVSDTEAENIALIARVNDLGNHVLQHIVTHLVIKVVVRRLV